MEPGRATFLAASHGSEAHIMPMAILSSVAVDEQGYAFLLSDHILIVSAKTPLAQFNAATQAESTFVDAGNVSDYLKFFVTSRLNWSDSLVFGGDSLARKVRELWGESDARRLADQTNDIKATLPTMGNIPVKDDENGHAFKAAVFEWRPNGTPPAMQRHDITIHPDGRIELNSEWIWRTNPESPWTEYSYPRHGFAITLPQARAPEENDENDIAAYDLYWNGSRDEDTQISARLIVNTRTDCASWLIKYRKELKLNPPVTLGDYSMTLDKPIKTHEVTIKGNPAFEGEFSLNVWSRAYFRQQCLNGTLFAFYALWPRSQTKPAIVDGMFDSFRLISSGIKK